MTPTEDENYQDSQRDEFGKPCPHCGDPLIWVDMFDIPWCETMFWGPVGDFPIDTD